LPGGWKEALLFGDGIWNCSLVWCFESMMIMSRGDFFSTRSSRREFWINLGF
jgi:hypothetical protein